MLLDPHRFSEEHRRSNPHLFAFFHASGLDARHETYRARLDTDSRTVKGGSARGINAETFLTVISRFKVERCRRSCDASVWCSIWTQSSVTESSADVGPNITGEIEMHSSTNAGLLYPDAEESGAFYKASYARITPSGATVSGNHLGLDASRSSGIFGESETVQPQAIRLLPCVKI